jgi:hypothetical protein
LSCFFIFNGKNFIGSLAFSPRLHVARAFFFSGFFFVKMVLVKLYTLALLWLRYSTARAMGSVKVSGKKFFTIFDNQSFQLKRKKFLPGTRRA